MTLLSSILGSWIHGVSFSSDGNRLSWVSHDSSISVADAGKQSSVVTLRTRFLPYLSLVWSSPQHIVAAVSRNVFLGTDYVLTFASSRAMIVTRCCLSMIVIRAN